MTRDRWRIPRSSSAAVISMRISRSSGCANRPSYSAGCRRAWTSGSTTAWATRSTPTSLRRGAILCGDRKKSSDTFSWRPAPGCARLSSESGGVMADRRAFLKSIAIAAVAGAVRPASAAQSAAAKAGSTTIHKSTLISMLPKELSYADRFALARESGFEAVEMQTITKDDEAAEIKEAAKKSGLRIHSVMNMDHWRLPLSSSDPEVVTGSVKGMETSLRNAALWGADTVLLVPAVVDAKTSYQDAWTRSQRVIRERLLPMAQDLKVTIAVEEVWNKFLLSPLEFARYVDDFASPYVRAYFDVGNVVFYAFPQD